MRLLFVSYHFPPSRTARSLQVGKLARALTRRGVDLDVITVSPSALNAHEHDPHVGTWVEHPRIRITALERPPRRGLDWVRAACCGENFPGWRRRASQAVREALSGARSYDAVVSFALPIDSHRAVAAALRRDVPWIAHFSDPWAGNPYMPAGGLRAWRLHRIERDLCARADLLVTVSRELADWFRCRHPACADRWQTLHHTFDPDLYPDASPPRDGPLVLCYLGGFSARRRPDVLIAALERAARAGADLSRLHVELVGPFMDQHVARFNALRPGLCSTRGPVSYAESLARMRTAHVLLVIDADVPASPYFPSKLADYFGSGRPIVAVTPPDGCTARLVRAYNGLCFGHAQIDDLAALLVRLSRNGMDVLPAPDLTAVRSMRADQAAQRFCELVRRAGRRTGPATG